MLSERLGEVELIGIAALGGDGLDWQIGKPHQLRSVAQPLTNQKTPGGLQPTTSLKLTAEVVAVQLTETGHLIHRQLPVVILLDIDYCLIDVKIPLAPLADFLPAV